MLGKLGDAHAPSCPRDELSDSLEPPEPPPRAYLLKASLLQGDEPLTRSRGGKTHRTSSALEA